MFIIDPNFQTPSEVAAYMVSMITTNVPLLHTSVLEMTPGVGNLVKAIKDAGYNANYPDGDFWSSYYNRVTDYHNVAYKYSWVCINPPFNPVKEMERFVNRAMELSDNVIALLPWTYIVNSERRLITLEEFGLESITSLPRKTFPGCRVQVAIFKLKKDHAGPTEFKRFSW